MQKEFDKWNNTKKSVNNNGENKFYHAREIWWCSFGVNIGFEQDGTGDEFRRPILVLKGLSKQTCIVVPLTASSHIHPLRLEIGLVDGVNAKVIISQIRVIDTKRFVSKIGYLDKKTFELIRKAVKSMF